MAKKTTSQEKTPARVAEGARTAPSQSAPPERAKTPAKKAAPVKARRATAEKWGGGPAVWWKKSAQFFREVSVELKRVTWPSRKESIASTSVVLVLVLLAAAFLSLVDFGLSRLIGTLVG